MKRVLFLALIPSILFPSFLPQTTQKKSPVNSPPQVRLEAKRFVVRAIDEAGVVKLLRSGAGDGATADAPPTAQPLLVNFWATWCVPCREEFPDLVKIDGDYRARGLKFVTVSLDLPEEINTTVPEFLMQMRATHIPAYLLNAENQEAVVLSVDKDWRGELPATFLFDRDGKLVFRHTGRVKPAELRAALDKILKAETAKD